MALSILLNSWDCGTGRAVGIEGADMQEPITDNEERQFCDPTKSKKVMFACVSDEPDDYQFSISDSDLRSTT